MHRSLLGAVLTATTLIGCGGGPSLAPAHEPAFYKINDPQWSKTIGRRVTIERESFDNAKAQLAATESRTAIEQHVAEQWGAVSTALAADGYVIVDVEGKLVDPGIYNIFVDVRADFEATGEGTLDAMLSFVVRVVEPEQTMDRTKRFSTFLGRDVDVADIAAAISATHDEIGTWIKSQGR